jgi:hypothetical protein
MMFHFFFEKKKRTSHESNPGRWAGGGAVAAWGAFEASRDEAEARAGRLRDSVRSLRARGDNPGEKPAPHIEP